MARQIRPWVEPVPAEGRRTYELTPSRSAGAVNPVHVYEQTGRLACGRTMAELQADIMAVAPGARRRGAFDLDSALGALVMAIGWLAYAFLFSSGSAPAWTVDPVPGAETGDLSTIQQPVTGEE